MRKKDARCPHCRQDLAAADALVVCSACGARQHAACWIAARTCATPDCQGEPLSGSVDPVFAHIRRHRDHYAAAAERLRFKDVTWNWAAFLAPSGWMLYRKIVWPAAAYQALWLLLRLLFPFPALEQYPLLPIATRLTSSFVWNLLPFVLRVPIALFADKYYFHTIRQKIARLRSESTADPTAILSRLVTEQDTSWGYFWGFGLLFLTASVVITDLVARIL